MMQLCGISWTPLGANIHSRPTDVGLLWISLFSFTCPIFMWLLRVNGVMPTCISRECLLRVKRNAIIDMNLVDYKRASVESKVVYQV